MGPVVWLFFGWGGGEDLLPLPILESRIVQAVAWTLYRLRDGDCSAKLINLGALTILSNNFALSNTKIAE